MSETLAFFLFFAFIATMVHLMEFLSRPKTRSSDYRRGFEAGYNSKEPLPPETDESDPQS